MMKLKESMRQKDEALDNLQEELAEYGSNHVRPAVDLNASMRDQSLHCVSHVVLSQDTMQVGVPRQAVHYAGRCE